MSEPFKVTVTRSAGSDGAVVVFVDGDFGETGLRILLNDDEVFVGKRYELCPETPRPARKVSLTFTLEDIDYDEEEPADG